MATIHISRESLEPTVRKRSWVRRHWQLITLMACFLFMIAGITRRPLTELVRAEQTKAAAAVAQQQLQERVVAEQAQHDAEEAQAKAQAARVAQEEQRRAEAERVAAAEAERTESARINARLEVIRPLVEGHLRDPTSAIYRNMMITPTGIICGEVNGKNGFGAYGDWTAFLVPSTNVAFFPDDLSNFQERVSELCLEANPKHL